MVKAREGEYAWAMLWNTSESGGGCGRGAGNRVLAAGGVAVAAALLTGCGPNTSDEDIVNVSTAEVAGLVEKAQIEPRALLLVDPRPRAEFEVAHLPTARNMPITMFRTDRRRDPRIERFEQIVVYGNDPASPVGRGTTKRLLELGYENVRFYAGGLKEWEGSGLPVRVDE